MNLFARLLLDTSIDFLRISCRFAHASRVPRRHSGSPASIEGVTSGSCIDDLVRSLNVCKSNRILVTLVSLRGPT